MLEIGIGDVSESIKHAHNSADDMANLSLANIDQSSDSRIGNRKEGSQTHIIRDPHPSSLKPVDLTLNEDIRKYFQAQDALDRSSKNSNWLSRAEIPTNDEFGDGPVELYRNRLKESYKSKNQYLKTHYAMLREDAVGPLREAVLHFLRDPKTMDTRSFNVYEKVHLQGYTFNKKGIAARVSFGMGRAERRVLWKTSRRLVSGSLVALIRASDKENTPCSIIPATVAARALRYLEEFPPKVDLFFGRAQDIIVDPQEEWIMIAAKQGYYEAHRHTLRALQKLTQECFPFSDEICHIKTERTTPRYIQSNPILCLEPAAKEEEKSKYSDVNVLDGWPASPPDVLDDSQWQALREMITSRLAIIQGPPGTGKTFVSTIALEILHKAQSSVDPPIIVSAQTNHALDQLLSRISRFEPEQGPDPFSTDVVLSTDTLYHLGVLTAKQAKSLHDATAQWISTTNDTSNPLRLWLDRALIPHEVEYENDRWGVGLAEDEELEFEHVRENEDGDAVNDLEDLEFLQGPFCSLKDKFTVTPATRHNLEEVTDILEKVEDMWTIPEYLRGPAYLVMRSRAIAKIEEQFRGEAKLYEANVKELQIGKWENDIVYLRRARIIGLTTTGLCKYRALVASLKPKIMLIEEAAEVLEASITAACLESLEHLILVGDHKQLQGHCAVPELAREPFFLETSLFERLVENNLPYRTLLCQRRMEPDFRALIQDIYPNLTDHVSVVDRKAEEWGMGPLKSFFFNHHSYEHRDDNQSIYNPQEAKLIAGLYRYLFKNGVTHDAVTILTFYRGQRKQLVRELREFPDIGHCRPKIRTVDSYQGEENSIVILSLTRSNDHCTIGFLENEHRVCVALSRAQHGFYLFGNLELLAEKSKIWRNVGLKMQKQRRVGPVLPLLCKHHGVTTLVKYPEQWKDNEGGCDVQCNATLDCGHQCRLKCHPYSHDQVKCAAVCKKELVCGHFCQKLCSEKCSCKCEIYDRLNKAAEIQRLNEVYAGEKADLKAVNKEETYFDFQRKHPDRINNNIGGHKMEDPFAHDTRIQIPCLMPDNKAINDNAPISLPTLPVGRFSQAPFPFRTLHKLSPEKKQENARGWRKFADGGVKDDDVRRDMQALAIADSANSLVIGTTESPSRIQASKETGNGRIRYSEEYCVRGAAGDDETEQKRKQIEAADEEEWLIEF